MGPKFLYDRYSKSPIKDHIKGVDINQLKTIKVVKSIDEQFEDYILSLEKQRGFKYSRKQKREIYRKFIKNLKRKKS